MSTFIQPQALATIAAKVVGLDLNVAALISRDLEADFSGQRGSKVRVPVPGAVQSHTVPITNTSTPLQTDDVFEQSIDVALTDHVYARTIVSLGAWDLQIQDFSRSITGPLARAVAADVERRTIAELEATPESSLTYDPANPAKLLTQMRAQLRQNKVRDDARLICVAGTAIEADLLDGPEGTFSADGRCRGFEMHYSNRLAPTEAVGFIPEAFTLVVRAPQTPPGVPFAASVIDADSDARFALTLIRAFDPSVGAESIHLGSFVQVQAMPLPVVDESTGTVALIEHGGAVRVDTAA